ncbi:hypothetical protein Tco_0187351, partial [Tanacetum coccineum]
MMSDYNSSDLVPQRQEMASAENNTSGPVPQCSKDNSEFKTTTMNLQVQSCCSSSSQDSYIMTRVGITIPPLYSNAEDN